MRFPVLLLVFVGGCAVVPRTEIPLPVVDSLITFSGRQWTVRHSDGAAPPRNNFWSRENVRVDERGDLHLRLRYANGRRYAAEVVSIDAFLYGRFEFRLVGRPDLLHPGVVLGLSTQDIGTDDDNELDIEFSRWGKPTTPTGSYVVWPAYRGSGNSDCPPDGPKCEFELPLGGDNSTHTITWTPERVCFTSLHGHYDAAPSADARIREWCYSGAGRPAATPHRVHINLWLLETGQPTDTNDIEVVVRQFTHTPRWH